MPNQLTSHAFRVDRAKEYIKKSGEPINIIDREALVEFFLLEDVINLYQNRLLRERNSRPTTEAGINAQLRNIEKFTAIINIFSSVVEIARAQINGGNYRVVSRAIAEHAIMVAAKNTKYISELRRLAVKMLTGLYDEARKLRGEDVSFNDNVRQLERHDKNARRIEGLPSPEEVQSIIDKTYEVIPDEKKSYRFVNKPNI